jgi:hypothetical protein
MKEGQADDLVPLETTIAKLLDESSAGSEEKRKRRSKEE